MLSAMGPCMLTVRLLLQSHETLDLGSPTKGAAQGNLLRFKETPVFTKHPSKQVVEEPMLIYTQARSRQQQKHQKGGRMRHTQRFPEFPHV